jgi:hypothetical protein
VIDAPADRFYRAQAPDRSSVVCKVDAGIGATLILGTILGEVRHRSRAGARENSYFEVRNSYDRLIWTADLDGRYPSSSTAPGSADTHFDGVGTRLNAAGANDQDIQSISRHADVSTTQAFYILRAVSGPKRALKS